MDGMPTAVHANEPPWTWHAFLWVMQVTRSPSEVKVTNDPMNMLMEAVAKHRDRQAFVQLFTHFAPRLKGFALKRGISPAAAEELVQETMLAVWRKAATFDRNRANVSTWIFTISRNKQIDLLRRQSYPEVELEMALDQPGSEPTPDQRAEWAEFGTDLQCALKSLSPEQRTILEKAFFEDKSHRTIALELNLPLGTVKSRIRLALARLRAVFPEQYV